jgi:hypothetical protein
LHLQTNFQKRANYLFAGGAESTPSAAPAGAVLVITTEFEFDTGAPEFGAFASPPFAVFAAAGAFVFASGAGVGVVVVSTPVDCSSEVFPFRAGIASIRADNIKVIAAPMVIRERIEAVPRGPKAVLETLLVKSAPASDLPGCSSTEAIKTTHAIKNIINKIVCIKT